jgi:hypothetical protein
VANWLIAEDRPELRHLGGVGGLVERPADLARGAAQLLGRAEQPRRFDVALGGRGQRGERLEGVR